MGGSPRPGYYNPEPGLFGVAGVLGQPGGCAVRRDYAVLVGYAEGVQRLGAPRIILASDEDPIVIPTSGFPSGMTRTAGAILLMVSEGRAGLAPPAPYCLFERPVWSRPVAKRLGIIGGGQLGMMLAEAASEMPQVSGVTVLDPVPGCPAAQVGARQITAGFGDATAIRRLAEVSDVITYEIESGDSAVLELLSGSVEITRPRARSAPSRTSCYRNRS